LKQQALDYGDGASDGLLPPARTKSITSQQINSSKYKKGKGYVLANWDIGV
jgi:hypothetical protein